MTDPRRKAILEAIRQTGVPICRVVGQAGSDMVLVTFGDRPDCDAPDAPRFELCTLWMSKAEARGIDPGAEAMLD